MDPGIHQGSVRFLPNPQPVQLGLKGGSVDTRGQATPGRKGKGRIFSVASEGSLPDWDPSIRVCLTVGYGSNSLDRVLSLGVEFGLA